MRLQRNVSRILSEEGEIPSSLFFMEGVIGRISVRGKPTHCDASLLAISFSIINIVIWSPLALPSLAV
jgi:hypothetical protein